MASKRRVGLAAFVVGGLVVAGALAFFVSPEASSEPDGLNKVAIDQGFDRTEAPHHLRDAPTAGYAVKGVDDDRTATGLAGLLGVGITFLLAAGLTLGMRRVTARRSRSGPADGEGGPGGAGADPARGTVRGMV